MALIEYLVWARQSVMERGKLNAQFPLKAFFNHLLILGELSSGKCEGCLWRESSVRADSLTCRDAFLLMSAFLILYLHSSHFYVLCLLARQIYKLLCLNFARKKSSFRPKFEQPFWRQVILKWTKGIKWYQIVDAPNCSLEKNKWWTEGRGQLFLWMYLLIKCRFIYIVRSLRHKANTLTMGRAGQVGIEIDTEHSAIF